MAEGVETQTGSRAFPVTGVSIGRFYLSPLEVAILQALANGMQSKEIAIQVGRSTPTVELYIRGLYLKLGARSRAHLVARAFCASILDSSCVASENESIRITAG